MASSLLLPKPVFKLHDKDGLELGLESIQYQGRQLHKTLTEAVAKLRAYNPATKKRFQTDDVVASEISKVIKDSTGLNCIFSVKPVTWENAAMACATFDQNHIFFDEYSRAYSMLGASGTAAIALLGEKARGSVDLTNSRVTGIFSQIPLETYVTYGLLANKQITNEEIAATILHEVGHAFTFIYYLGHVVTSNIVITHAARRVMGVADTGERVKILKEATKVLGIEVPKLEDVVQSESTDIQANIETVFIGAHRKHYRSITNTDLYDARACEQLADHFAIMHGAGAHIATDLYKLYKKYGDSSTSSYAMYLFTEVAKTILISLVPMGLPLMLGVILTTSPAVEIYDRPLDRTSAVRRQLNQILKDQSLSKAEKEYTLKQIEIIQSLELKMNRRETWFNNVANILNPRYSFYKKQVNNEKLLEDLVFNDLFAKSAQLSLN